MPNENRNLTNLAIAAAAGAALMYLFDPHQGARRRAQLRDKAAAGKHDLADYAQTQAKRVLDHARGLAARVRPHVNASLRDVDTSDYQIGERIRAQLGHVLSHPGAVEVDVSGGCACLSGHILASEHDAVLSTVWAVPGVTDLADELTIHEKAGNIPALQG